MSDNIPFEIQVEIMKRLPVKSLIQFRSVCKSWKSLIDSADFIAQYSSQQQHLLVKYQDEDAGYPGLLDFVSIVDDHSFPQQKVSLTVPVSVKKLLEWPMIIGSSHGLVCLYCSSTHKAVVWNISIRKAVAIVVPTSDKYATTLGFGVCRETSDPKIVKVRYVDQFNMENVSSSIPSQVEVYTLSTGYWRSSFGNLPRESIFFHRYDEVVLDGVFYWLATDMKTMTEVIMLIVSFDMTSEEFREITFPDGADTCYGISMSCLGDSLVVCGYDKKDINKDFCVWMMGGGVSKSFTKLFTITLNQDYIVEGFRKSGEPIINIQEEGQCGRLAIYEPNSKRIDDIGIDGVNFSFEVYPYMETLFLLDQPDITAYNCI